MRPAFQHPIMESGSVNYITFGSIPASDMMALGAILNSHETHLSYSR